MKMLNTVRLTDNQKRVICKIIAAPTPKIASEEISKGPNLIQAKDTLIDLHLIIQTLDDHAELTDAGRQIAQDENLADESGQLTPDGEEFARSNEDGTEDQSTTEEPTNTNPVTNDPMADMGSAPPTEPLMMSYSSPPKMPLLKELLFF